MLCLLGVMLSVLCLVSPAPCTPAPRPACPSSALIRETIEDVRKLSSKGSSEIAPLSYTMEAGGNAATYLEGFIAALKNSKESEGVVKKLKDIQTYEEKCTGWMSALKEHHWNAVEEYDFFTNLEYLLRFLGHNALPEKTN